MNGIIFNLPFGFPKSDDYWKSVYNTLKEGGWELFFNSVNNENDKILALMYWTKLCVNRDVTKAESIVNSITKFTNNTGLYEDMFTIMSNKNFVEISDTLLFSNLEEPNIRKTRIKVCSQ